MGYQNVLVGTDGSPTAQKAVEHASALAAAYGARLTILTAFTEHRPDEQQRDEESVPDDLRWMLTDAAQADDKASLGKDIATKAGVKDIHTRVWRGDPADGLVETAEDIGADLLVVGSRGMTSASRFLLGSVPNRVSHHAPCDLVIVRTAE